jgi:hypothetical protein
VASGFVEVAGGGTRGKCGCDVEKNNRSLGHQTQSATPDYSS